MKRIPSLDGLRAFSITLVIFGHLNGTADFPVPHSLGYYFAVAELGVRVFFVISGFIITDLLLKELDHTGRISLRGFYLRRSLRIFPPYYLMLACVAAASLLGVIVLEPGDLWHALTYTTNYHAQRGWNLGHTWSLAVEEQFYLLWPAILVLLGRPRGLKAALVVVALVPFIRIGEWYGGSRVLIGNTFETVADALATGCLLAGYRDILWKNTRYRNLLTSRWFILVPAFAFALSALERPRISFAIGVTLSNLCIAATIDWCMRFADGRVGRLLNARPVVFLGLLSYSLYLWQQAFLNRTSSSITAHFPENIALACMCACLSFYLVERPSLRLRKRLEGRTVAPVEFTQDASPVGTMAVRGGG